MCIRIRAKAASRRWIIRSGRSQILGLYPLLPDRMEVDRDSAGTLTYTYSTGSG